MRNRAQILHQTYGFWFPDSFFEFQEFVASLAPNLIRDVLGGVLGVRLEAPFSILQDEQDVWRSRWRSRYYNDPPEFFTLLSGDTDGLHWGYYIDDPSHPTFPVVSYYASDAFELAIDGDNLFDALREKVELTHESLERDMKDDPYYKENIDQLAMLRCEIQKHDTADRPEMGRAYTEVYRAGEWRKVVAQTRDGMGIVVPQESYAPLADEDKFQIWNYQPEQAEVERLSERAFELLAQGYAGAALKLGKDIWVYPEGREISYRLLDAAYEALGRDLLRQMLQVAKAYREDCDARRRQ